MSVLKIGIIREGRIPVDRRVPLLPLQCVEIQKKYNVEFIIQPSDIRCIANKEYAKHGLTLSEDLSPCQIILGIKEVPIHLLFQEKTYLFFSHTIKMQAHNQKLLQAVIEKKITLIDYECLKDEEGNRIIAFGRFAGIVGAYNGLLIYGKKNKIFNLKRAYQCFDLHEIRQELNKVILPNVRIAITGSGRVAKGAMEILKYLNIPELSPEAFVSDVRTGTAYTHLHSMAYHQKKDNSSGQSAEFYSNPHLYKSTFNKYFPFTDILIAAAYWNPKAPMMFTREEMKDPRFRIKVIADITCDVGGSIPSTIKASTIYDPAYDYNPHNEAIEAPFSDEKNITVMAIDNLPGELPRDASQDFGEQLIKNVFPYLFLADESALINRASIVKQGQLNSPYKYLESFAK